MQSHHHPDGISSADSDETFVIYFLMEDDDVYSFYRIPDDQPPPSETGEQFLPPVSSSEEDDNEWSPPPLEHNFLQPDFKLDTPVASSPACAAVGSTIYLFGGDDSEPFISHNKVYYIDTRRPENGWKQGKPMENPRTGHLGLSVNNNKMICAIGGFDRKECGKVMPIEVYNPEDDSWETKCDLHHTSLRDFAVFPDGKEVLLLTSDRNLLIYNVEDDIVGTCIRPQFKDNYGPIPIAMVVLGDEILYTASFTNDGEFQVMGYDILNKGGCCPVKVTGLGELMDYRSDYLLPQTSYVIGGYDVVFPEIKLVAIGKKKLAVVWTLDPGFYSYVNCLKMEIEKAEEEEDDGLNQMMRLNAHSGSFTSHIVKGFGVTQYIPVKRDNEQEHGE